MGMRSEVTPRSVQVDWAIVADVVDVSLLVQQNGPAGFPLGWNLAFGQVVCEEPSQCIDEYWWQILQVFGSALVWTRCCTRLYQQSSMSDFGREDVGNDISILQNLAYGQVDVAIEEI